MPEQANTKLERASSQTSTRSHKPGTVRTRSRKQSLVTPNSDKSLTSFPSLSPENSLPNGGEGKFRSSPKTPKTPHTPFKARPKSPSIVDALVRKTSTFKGRPALFEDSPKATGKEVPGPLHSASDEYLRHLVAKDGAVPLVRQLAEDLAERDAEITSLRRRAEERERELKKMLQEVEVSNLDIETRLHQLDSVDGFSAKRPSPRPQVPGSSKSLARDRLGSIMNGIDQMMGEAMSDSVGSNTEIDDSFVTTPQEQDKQATIRATGVSLKDADRRSMNSSIDSQGKGTVRGWKDYLWSGSGTSRKSSRASSVVPDDVDAAGRKRGYSGGNGRRKGLDEDLFTPPQQAAASQSQLENDAVDDARSVKSASSVIAWTTRLFAGSSQAGRDGNRTIRGRSSTTGTKTERTSRAPSAASTQTAHSAMASLVKVNTGDGVRTVKKSVPPLPLGSNSNLKGSFEPGATQSVGSPKATGDGSNLGPVEMDTILPFEARPPTQTQIDNKNQGTEFLTDRFGFIYDQRRRMKAMSDPQSQRHRHKKSVSSGGIELLSNPRDPLKSKVNGEDHTSIQADSTRRPGTPGSADVKTEEKPTKRWQDYLKVATFPTELLSHTPSSKPIIPVIEGDNSRPSRKAGIQGETRASLPSASLVSKPSLSNAMVENAEMVSPSGGSPKQTAAAEDLEPVRLLLNQLTELHDSLQRDRTVKWNEFLRKVRAERKKEGETLTMSNDSRSKASMPEILLSDGEMIGVAGLGNKGKVGRAKYNEFKQLVLAGIPVAYRAKIWAECSGASALRVPGYYDDLVNNSLPESDDPINVAQIEMDIHRTLTDNVFFRKGLGVSKLNEVLLAYSRRNPEVGYCQGMNLITASLLLIMPTAEDAFWMLTSIIENILPEQYYDRSLLASRADQKVLLAYTAEILPKLSEHFETMGIELEALTFQWFLSLFTDCLSAEALYRIWDVVFCFPDGGSTFLFQVALALLQLNEGDLLALDSPGAVYGFIGSEMCDHAISIDGLVAGSEGLRGVVRKGEVEERRRGVMDGGRREGGLSVREPRPVVEEEGR
ncbi:MAG: hypothetical protein L6R37_000816 [Teloschistes peruensis]|nr:MAG: hypothetical protein L6R37_000816 [Teloschistes peruensis]